MANDMTSTKTENSKQTRQQSIEKTFNSCTEQSAEYLVHRSTDTIESG